MEQFAFIDMLEAYAISKGWNFVLKFDDFYGNIEVQKDYDPGELVLTVDYQSIPVIQNGRVVGVTYVSLMALGRKFDADTTGSSLDETYKQKYDRRLKDLEATLANSLAEFACDNQLDVTTTGINNDINVYDTNIDFVITTATFTQDNA